MSYIVRNCPARRDVKIFGYSCSHIATLHCYNQPDCLIKQVIELCKQKVEFCKNCSKHANVSIDCVECDERGEATLGKCILQLFEIEGYD